jgi:hypothetical protein
MTRAITYCMTLFPWKTHVSQCEPRSQGLGLYLLDDPFRRRLGQLRYQDMRKDAITQAITYWMTLFPWKIQVSQCKPRSHGLVLYLLDDPLRRRLGQLIYQNMRKEAMTRAITYWMTLFP